MHSLVASLPHRIYGDEPVEDHHGGGLWLKDDDGWFLVRNQIGIEWSASFCADPAKVDLLRQNARRLYAAFPAAVSELGIRVLLDTPITDLAGVQAWVDSICNASLPLPAEMHRGVLPPTAGMHHYPAPVMEIEFIKYEDFELWQYDERTDEMIAVTPVGARGSGEGSTRLAYAAPAFSSPDAIEESVALQLDADRSVVDGEVDGPENIQADPKDVIFPADHPFSRRAFSRQVRMDD
jgi:hypothetical protein